MRNDLRLLPAALTAWGAAALALTGWSPLVGAAGLAAAAAVGVRWRGTRSDASPRHQVLLCAAVAVAVLISARAQLAASAASLDGTGEADVVVTATAVDDARELGPFSTSAARVTVRLATLEVDGAPRRARARVTALGDVLGVHRGDVVRLEGTLVTLPDSEEVRALLVEARVRATAAPSGLRALFPTMRARFREATEALSPQGRGLVPGVAIGDDSALPETLREAMRRTSLGHLTAVSGAHVALVLAGVGVLGARAPTRLRAALLLLALAGLVGLVGSAASVVRAAAMGVTGIVALARGRPPRALPALASGVVFLLVADPWLSRSIGFALSVAATTALVTLAPCLANAFARLRLRRWLATTLAVPCAAHLACAPIIVLFTPTVSVLGVVANAIAAPAVVPATLLGLAGVLAAPASQPLAAALAHGAEACTWWIAQTATTIARLPLSAAPWPGGLGGALGLAAVHGALVVVLLHARLRVLLPALLVVVVAALLLGARESAWTVVQCDVGQGSALLVRSGPHAAVMVDVGPSDGRSQECLRRSAVTRIDLLVLTHPHADHVGNLAAVLASTRVERVLVSPAAEPREAVSHVGAELAVAGAEPEVATAGLRGRAGSVDWEVLWPSRTTPLDDANDLSVAVLLRAAGGGRVLALGDLGAGQRGLADAVTACGAPCTELDVVAMAHHGSRDQDATLARLLDPAITLVSVGAQNPYGHPTSEALSLYADLGSRIWRTDRDGAVRILLDGTGAVRDGGP